MPRNLLTVPHINQQYKADCLAACAAMLLAYTDVSIPYERLLHILDVQPYGTPGRNLYRLSQMGIEVVYRAGTMSTLEELIESGKPCLTLVHTESLHYWTYSTEHAVVVVGTDDDGVFLNDPAFVKHPMRVTKLEFELAWMEFDYLYCTMTV